MLRVKSVLVVLLLGLTTAVLAAPWGGVTPVQVAVQASDGNPSSSVQKSDTLKQAEQHVLTAKKQAPALSHSKTADTTEQPAIVLLAKQLNQLHQNTLLYQQGTNFKLNDLTTKLKTMQTEVKQLDQALLLLNQEMVGLTHQLDAAKAKPKPKPKPVVSESTKTSFVMMVSRLQQHLGVMGFYAMIAGIVIILLLVVAFLWPRKRRIAPVQASDTEDEYDYMGSNESIPAKLNLARAYIAMEDYASAKKTIAEILSGGSQEQCSEAQNLLNEIPRAS